MEQKKKLFSEFDPVSTQAWEEQIARDLKGADYEKKLIWNTQEGIRVKPYYRYEDLSHIQWLKAFPGEFPYVRGNKASGNNWLVRQDIKVEDIGKTNEKALDILMKGVDSLGFVLDCKHTYSLDEIEALLKNIRADIAEINFSGTNQHLHLVQIIASLVDKYNRPFDKIYGSVNFDPLLRFSRRGQWYQSEVADMETAAALIREVQKFPVYRVIGVNGHIFANAGANIVQEMAFTLSAGSEYLTRLTEKGFYIGEVAPHIKFNLAVGSNYFMEIAKLRAYRLLWAKIVNAYGLNDARNGRMYIHAENSSWNFTLYDPYVNMLRTTTGTMSALIGGVDSFRVTPFDVPYESPTDFAERIARNQQLILKEESYLDRVADPAAGSYYVENLTTSLVEAAWQLFLQIQDEGGFISALRKGSIQNMIAESALKRDMNIATRREILLGTNQYPNFNENISTELPATVFEAEDKTLENAEIKTIKTYRGGQAFEILRYKTDQFSRTNKRPEAWMLTYGNLAMRKARANFACNFFACAGFTVTDNPGFADISEGIEAARQRKPEIVVLCSSDEEYTDNVKAAFEALRKDCLVVLAGFPAGLTDELKAAGMEHFIHVKSNVLETLQMFQQKLGIH
jgi:methylmalonyl-CoA mutase